MTARPPLGGFEFLPAELCESRLRKELVHDSLSFEDGVLGLPAGPGLGFELNRDAVQEFIAAARNAPTVQAA